MRDGGAAEGHGSAERVVVVDCVFEDARRAAWRDVAEGRPVSFACGHRT